MKCPLFKTDCLERDCVAYHEEDAHTLAHINQFCRLMWGDKPIGTRFPRNESERSWLENKRKAREDRIHSYTEKAREDEKI